MMYHGLTYKRGVEMETEVCELCAEQVTYCSCWRCMECEELQEGDADGMESETGEMVCLTCWNA